MKSFNVLKVLLQFLLIIALVILTYLRFDKLSQEETSMTYSTVSKEIYLPSVTICFRAYDNYSNAPKMDTTTTFQEFMESSQSVKDLLIEAMFKIYGPNEQIRHTHDFLEGYDDEFIEESYYLVALENEYFGLNRCITINAPITYPVFFKDAYVRIEIELFSDRVFKHNHFPVFIEH